MKAKSNDDAVPNSLREVWAWKDAVYHATEALQQMHADAAAVRKTFGLQVSEPRAVAACVAETPADYGKIRK